MTIHELREKRAKAWEAAKAFLDAHRTGNGTLTAEDDATYTRMEQEITDLGKEIARLERQEAMDAELNKPVNKPITGQPENDKVEIKTGRASNAYKEDFGLHLRGKALVHNVLSTTPDVDGGFLVPTDYEDKLVESLEEENVMRRLCKVITTHHERKIPVAVGHSVAQWTAENASYTESNPTFGQKQIDAFKLTDLCRISTELLKDSSFDIEDYLRGEFARAFGIAEEQAFCVGNGTNQPTGLFTANGGTVGVTAASATAITVDEVINLIHALCGHVRLLAEGFCFLDVLVPQQRKSDSSFCKFAVDVDVVGFKVHTDSGIPFRKEDGFDLFVGYGFVQRPDEVLLFCDSKYIPHGMAGTVYT